MKQQVRRLMTLMLAVIMAFATLPVTAADEVELQSPENFIEYVSEYSTTSAAHVRCEDNITPADLTRLARWLGGHFIERCPKGGCVRCT